VTYGAKSLQAKLSNGNVLANGSVVPPGPYSVVVYDGGDDPSPQFAMSGPGVSVASDLNPNGTGIEVPMTFGPFVLEPSASYTIYDAGIGGTAIGFTTAATGTSASPDATTTTQAPAQAARPLAALALAVTPGQLLPRRRRRVEEGWSLCRPRQCAPVHAQWRCCGRHQPAQPAPDVRHVVRRGLDERPEELLQGRLSGVAPGRHRPK
jgi:hypothetical protein